MRLCCKKASKPGNVDLLFISRSDAFAREVKPNSEAHRTFFLFINRSEAKVLLIHKRIITVLGGQVNYLLA